MNGLDEKYLNSIHRNLSSNFQEWTNVIEKWSKIMICQKGESLQNESNSDPKNQKTSRTTSLSQVLIKIIKNFICFCAFCFPIEYSSFVWRRFGWFVNDFNLIWNLFMLLKICDEHILSVMREGGITFNFVLFDDVLVLIFKSFYLTFNFQNLNSDWKNIKRNEIDKYLLKILDSNQNFTLISSIFNLKTFHKYFLILSCRFESPRSEVYEFQDSRSKMIECSIIIKNKI